MVDGIRSKSEPRTFPEQSPTTVRYRIIGISVLMAFIMYLDRVCLGEIVKSSSFLSDLKIPRTDIGDIQAGFFWTYALLQVPAGWISDRFGARRMLTIYILSWSLLTGLTGLMTTTTGLLLARMGMGVAQAGAYPTSSGIIRRWIPLQQRGRASSLVSFGGRVGGTLAPVLTTTLILNLGGWRPTLFVYMVTGGFIALGYWCIVRNRAGEHPGCNQQERDFIGNPQDDRRPELADILPMLVGCCRSRSLWLNSAVQFGVNVGWAYLITWLPTYLKESKGLTEQQGALMVTSVLAMGMAGQLIGGWATDAAVRRFGLRWGRGLPIAMACFTAGSAYLCCPWIDQAWGIVVCCGIVSLMTDIGNPSSWAFMQDIGGRNTSAIYGWGNMWGNFGAAFTAAMAPRLLKFGTDSGYGENLVFCVCGAAFFAAGLAALGMDATKPVEISHARSAQPSS